VWFEAEVAAHSVAPRKGFFVVEVFQLDALRRRSSSVFQTPELFETCAPWDNVEHKTQGYSFLEPVSHVFRDLGTSCSELPTFNKAPRVAVNISRSPLVLEKQLPHLLLGRKAAGGAFVILLGVTGDGIPDAPEQKHSTVPKRHLAGFLRGRQPRHCRPGSTDQY